ncbi:hypothetical protein NODU109028_19730 [Nocardioides dubius]|uniref:Addiction module antidote protein n=1 Tax=Nocardioides dubius TaxID=317019 RepID=A0ABN1U3G7_9ACTN
MPTFSDYDPADYLTSPHRIIAYLEAVLEEAGDDPGFIAQALRVVARACSFATSPRDGNDPWAAV